MTTTTQPEEIASEDLSDSLNTTMMRRILASSFLGSMIEFYDFILFATAASIVFSQVYFVDLDPGLGLFLSFTILAVGYVARPIGGIVFGHFGDKIGRKGVLVTSMMLMGGTTVAIGLLPPTATIGVAAPILLTVFRVIQGLAVGGEWGGAMLIALEHSPKKRRGFAASFANMGGPAGAVLATVVMSVFTLLPDEQFISWGWRIPFLLSAVLVFIGLIIRMKVHESPIFQKLQDKADERKVPLLEVISKYPKNLILGIIAGMSSYTVQGLMTVWGISYVINSGLDSTHVLWVKALGAASTVVVVWFASQLSDRFGRRPVMIVGMFIGAVAAFPVMFMLDMSNLWVFAMALLITQGLVQGTIFGPFGAFAAEMFPTHIRYTGASLVYQTSSTLGAGFTPMIASSLVAIAGGSLWLIAVVWIAVFLIAILAISFVKEGRTADLEGDMR
ncbi:MAG: MHS family MFS transporter [Yaniella sp.]|uniref:MFS transporter n=1 Tax=Yaniella sp. TaxID=2773929 RepID=UPI0026497D52|nr:MFS transporter [Yaniella sp.]MDN5705274.1 MHS family MFS transporter [Yaniella sp.]MDN5732297.1 MHS family MFS transporter [Yaniella sp.]MDN5816457.1 MHS family MFS transporter [Yaniella sp.]MDN5818026.1 MHS family MFS transporter [Yaniella sp.]MDN5839132.1 MHS family MFS transporter [Yaniella sp.]